MNFDFSNNIFVKTFASMYTLLLQDEKLKIYRKQKV